MSDPTNSRPLSPLECQWVVPRLTKAPKGARRPVAWHFLLSYLLVFTTMAYLLYSSIVNQGSDGWKYNMQFLMFLWLLGGMAMLIAGQGESAAPRAKDSDLVAHRIEGRCEHLDPATVPRFCGLPCHLPPGWETRFPEGLASLEVVAARDPRSPIEDDVPIGDGRFWVVVGMGDADRLETEIARGLLDYQPDRTLRHFLAGTSLTLALLGLGLSGPTWGFHAWDNFLRREFVTQVLDTEGDQDRVALDPGREVVITKPLLLAEDLAPPHTDGLVPVALTPGADARHRNQQILEAVVRRIEARDRWLGGDLESLREDRLRQLLTGPDSSLTGNRSWDAIQALLWRPLWDDPDDSQEFLSRSREKIADQAFTRRSIQLLRVEEARVLDSLAALAQAALRSGNRPFWIQGLEGTKARHRPFHPDDALRDVLGTIRDKTWHGSSIHAVLSESSPSGWIARSGGRTPVLLAFVVGWLILSVLLIPWSFGKAFLQIRRNRRYLAAIG